MKNKFMGALGIGAVIVGGYFLTKKMEKVFKDKDIVLQVRALAENISKNKKVLLSFEKIIKEDWDNMYVFPSYTPYSEINEELGFEWEGVYETSINYKDTINLLVFVKDKEVVAKIEYPIIYGDFSRLNGKIYNKENAVFELSNEDNNIVVREFTKE